ncbi:uncharacterized protein NECHADRAFT_38913 [Fusarium vanettenii 77-13-4]|uniref:EXS domain-containing protein n=1 Tax=Fusarium vanettenii (strain ATCC MYA-4622 / CBS 123669 / FGSC 9596 / NRRL 45880 / 77-13-4) TaxID=660122 RepID=C7YQ40_FUSV7|nr:uncharacterized protein NECHADRAFT_38913 [Fusarium vanettenii 77-13-4]EEU46404.1 predicted protein [Fusarium vanettenii 77-13-4]
MDGDPAVDPELDSFSLAFPLPYRRVIAYGWMPLSYLFALVVLFVVPLRNLPSGGRRRFLATLRRVSIGGLAEAQDGKFGDILLADVLTSYAKVFGDLFVTLCMFFSAQGSSTKRPDRNCGGTVIVPLIMGLPSLIRFRQCLIEYYRVRRAPYKESTGWGGQHLANALKYSSAFPVLITSAWQRSVDDPESKAILHKAWIVAVLINSLYSFYWDVTKDWDMTLFASKRDRESPHHPFGLRDRLVFRVPNLYYFVIGMDLMLRCTWSIKLNSRLDKFSDLEGGIFLIEFLEVFRRWVWIFFRVETEWIRNSSTGLGIDDILLGDYQGKDDEED